MNGGGGGLRVLYLHQHFSTPAGSTGTRSFAMARALAARGHAVTVACGRYAGAESGLGGAPSRRGRREGRVGAFRVVEFAIPCGNAQSFAARAGAFARYAARASALALCRPWDVMVASSTPLTVALPALLARRARGTPFVFEIRDPWPELPRAMGVGSPPLWAAMDRLADAACRRAAVVGLSEGMAETAVSRGADPAAVSVVPNGADLDLFGPQVAPWRPEEARPHEALAVYAGAHGRANGLDLLLRAAGLLRAQGAPLRLLLVGEGSEKPRLAADAAAAGLDNLSFLDPLPKPRLAALLAGSPIGVQCLAPVPEFAEWTAPNKLMDYLADGPCGIATPPGDAAALAGALSALAASPARRAALGAAARAQAVRRWDRRLLAARFCDVVEGAAAADRRAAAPASPSA